MLKAAGMIGVRGISISTHGKYSSWNPTEQLLPLSNPQQDSTDDSKGQDLLLLWFCWTVTCFIKLIQDAPRLDYDLELALAAN